MYPIIEISNQNPTPARFVIIVYYHLTTNLPSLNAPPLRTNKSLKHINIIVIDAIAYNYYNAVYPIQNSGKTADAYCYYYNFFHITAVT